MLLNLLTKFTAGYENSTKYLYLKLFDANTNNKTVPHVSLFVTISQNNKTLMNDLFHSETEERTRARDSSRL
jgi:hypothetical protein